MTSTTLWIAFGCFFEWGLIHILAGITTFIPAITNDIPTYLMTICQAAPQAVKDEAQNQIPKWSPMNIRILIQHSLNLGFVGLWSTALALFVLLNSSSDHDNIPRAAFYLGLWPFFADVAYFYAIDTVHYGSLLAELQTIIVSTGLFCTGLLVKEQYELSEFEASVTFFLPMMLAGASVIGKGMHLFKGNGEGYEAVAN